jgi:hypothetical protein
MFFAGGIMFLAEEIMFFARGNRFVTVDRFYCVDLDELMGKKIG